MEKTVSSGYAHASLFYFFEQGVMEATENEGGNVLNTDGRIDTNIVCDNLELRRW